MNEKLFFEEIGQGKPLICLHGFALDHTIWLKMSEEIKTNVRLILPDLRGHGKSFAPDGKYSMRVMAEDVLYLMDELKLECVDIAGHSLGGYIALAFAEYYPDRLSGLALVASHAFEDLPEKKNARLEDIENVRRSSVNEVLAEMPVKLTRDPEIAEFCRQLISQTGKNAVMGALAGMAERPARINVIEEIKKPIMIIAGNDDQFIPLETSREMAENVEELIFVQINSAGHMVMMEKPFETGSALLDLINSSEENHL